LLVTGNYVFEVLAEVFIKRHRRVSLFSFLQDFGDGSSAAVGRDDHGDRPVALTLD
jgi:hypothetical protein